MFAEDIFILNLSLDFIILIATNKILKNHAKLWRIIVASAFGGVYSVLVYFPLFNNFAIKFIASLFICIIAFNYYNFNAFFKNLLAFYASSFILAGALTGIFNIFDFGNTFPIKTFLITTSISFILLNYITKSHKNSKKQDEVIKNIEIHLFGKSKTLKALQDTGNMTDSIIVEYDKVKEILPNDFCINYEKDDTYYKLLGKYKFDVIPCQTANGTSLLLAIPDGDKKIALTKENLSNDGKFEAIM